MLELLIFGGTLLTTLAGYAIGRKTAPAPEEKDTSFICPYCQNVVTGFKELDLIHHVTCIGKSQADLEAEAKKPKKTYADEYFVRWGTRYRKPGENFDAYNYNVNTGSWWVHSWELYRNGEKIESGSAKTKNVGETKAQEAIDFDEYQRRTSA